jgi:hypothetical protein
VLTGHRDSKALAAQRDLVLVDFMKMHAPHCKSITQLDKTPQTVSRQAGHSGIESNTYQQPETGDACVRQVSKGLTIHQSLLPSIEVQHVQEDDGTRRDSATNASSSGDTEEGSEVYEPPDVLSDDVDDEAAQKDFNRGYSYHGNLAVSTMATDVYGLNKNAGYEHGSGDVNWDAHTSKRKLGEKPKPKPKVNWVYDRVDEQGTQDDDDARMRKRLKIESIVH